MIKTLSIFLLSAGLVAAQGVGVTMHGGDVTQNAAATNGGYMHFAPITYNPHDGSTCLDQWTNPVQEPLPTGNLSSFGANDALFWLSASPSMPFATTGAWSSVTSYTVGQIAVYAGVNYVAIAASLNQIPPSSPTYWIPTWGLVQPVVYNVGQAGAPSSATGPCGIPLPVNTNYGLNTNVYIFARGGLATDQTFFNSIQSLQGGVLANSYTAGAWYPTGTVVCTAYNGTTCTATGTISGGLCPGGAVGCYLGGHVDTGHSVGPPASGGIATVTNPFSGGEGLVAGQIYFDDGVGCERAYDGSAWGCIGNKSEIYNALGTGTSNCVQQFAGTFAIKCNGDAAFQSLALTNGLTVDSGTYGLSGSGVLTVASCTGCGGGVTSFNTRTGAVSLLAADVAAVEQDLRTSATPTFAGAIAVTFNCTATSTTPCITQNTGTWSVTGAGDAAFQSIVATNDIRTTAGRLRISGTTGTNRVMTIETAGVNRWFIGGDNGGEAGGNQGTDFFLRRFSDGGSTIDNPIFIHRNDGIVHMDQGISIAGYGINPSGALSVTSCTGCGGVTSFNTRTGTVSLLAADVASVEQDLRTSASPTFAATTAVTFNCTATSTTACITQSGGTWSVTGAGNAAFQSLALTNGLTVDSGAYGLSAAGVLTVASCTGCATAAGSNTQVQFNSSGSLGASANFTFASNTLTVGSGAGTGVIAPLFNATAGGTNLEFQGTNSSIRGDGHIATNGYLDYGNITATTPTPTSGHAYEYGDASGLHLSANGGAFSLVATQAWVNSNTVNSIAAFGSTGITFTASTGAVSVFLAQDIRTSAGPTWNTVTASTFFNCAATGSGLGNACIKQSSGTWYIDGAGLFAGQAMALGSNNGTNATAGAGATVSNSAATIGLVEYDTGGHCNVGTGSFGCVSDLRLKKNVQSVYDGLSVVEALRPVTFNWLGNGEPSVGFIAQEVRTVIPNIVRPDDNGYLVLTQQGIIPYLVRAIQEQQAEIDDLRAGRFR